MILQNRIFGDHFGCMVVFTIKPCSPTIITSTAFLVLATFCTQNQFVVTFISFYMFVWYMYTHIGNCNINIWYLNLFLAMDRNWLNRSPSAKFLVLYRYANSSQYKSKCFLLTKWYTPIMPRFSWLQKPSMLFVW